MIVTLSLEPSPRKHLLRIYQHTTRFMYVASYLYHSRAKKTYQTDHLVEDSPAASDFVVAPEAAAWSLGGGEVRRHDAVADKTSRPHEGCR